jgi:3-phosphoshikimate 1-carboxyvinyltransferase
MERTVEPSSLKGTVRAPSSKSMTQRAIAAAVLAPGQTTLMNPSYCDDSLAAMSIAVGLGARLEPGTNELRITGGSELKETRLNCGESGLAIRMFSPIAALYRVEVTMLGGGSLKKRPMGMIEEALEQLGVKCETTDGFLPLTIRGPIKGGNLTIDGSVSSQLLTGLLMALPVAPGNTEIEVMNLKSKPYIDMTLQVLNDFGIRVENDNYRIFYIKGKQKFNAREYVIEGDWSGAAFLLVGAAINGNLTVEGLDLKSRQSDMAIMEALRKAGAKIATKNSSIEVSKSELKAFEMDATESPDLFPPLAALASYCRGESRIRGVSRLIHKESNRAVAIKDEFGKLGISIRIEDDVMTITGGKVTGGNTASHEDHRIAMAMAVTALGASGKVSIKDSHSIAKSYPEFFNDIKRLGAVVIE